MYIKFTWPFKLSQILIKFSSCLSWSWVIPLSLLKEQNLFWQHTFSCWDRFKRNKGADRHILCIQSNKINSPGMSSIGFSHDWGSPSRNTSTSGLGLCLSSGISMTIFLCSCGFKCTVRECSRRAELETSRLAGEPAGSCVSCCLRCMCQ